MSPLARHYYNTQVGKAAATVECDQCRGLLLACRGVENAHLDELLHRQLSMMAWIMAHAANGHRGHRA